MIVGNNRRRDRRRDDDTVVHRTATVAPVIPLRDDNPTRSRSWVTWGIIAFTSLVWLVAQPHGAKSVLNITPKSVLDIGTSAEAKDLSFTLGWAAVPCEVKKQRPLTVGEVLATFEDGASEACGKPKQAVLAAAEAFPSKSVAASLFVSIFLHGGLLHLAGNMLFLFIFGNNIEDRWGKGKYLLFYLAAGLFATLAHVFAAPNSTIPVVGASGAIAGVMGAYLVLYPKVRVTTVIPVLILFTTKLPAWVVLGVWFVSQFFIAPSAGVAWVAHVGGFLFGIAVALIHRGPHGKPESARPAGVIYR